MNARQFYEAVRKMRMWQKMYFTTRTQKALEESKKAERIIDAEIERVEEKMQRLREPGLFG